MKHASRRCFLAAALALLTSKAAAIDVDGDFYFDTETPTPAAVLALQNCDADDKTPAHRKKFAGGFVFLIQCASNNENFVETLLFSEHEDGTDGWLLNFPLPDIHGGGSQDTISNIRWYPDKSEIGEIAVDSDVDSRPIPNVCRSEGRWRLEGKKRTPKLVFWRETPDCDGKTGWKIIVGKS
jgi:hypothetical protein